MNYETTESLFRFMDDLETYSKMHATELYKDEPDWQDIGRYDDNIKQARKNIFTIMQKVSNG